MILLSYVRSLSTAGLVAQVLLVLAWASSAAFAGAGLRPAPEAVGQRAPAISLDGPQQTQGSFSPVIFVPGDGGSRLEARLNRSETVHFICNKYSDWYDIWLNLHLLTPIVFDCLCDNLKLAYNRTSRRTENTPGVDIRIAGHFGDIESIAYLDVMKLYDTDYFENIVASLEKNNGLRRNSEIFGAAFDFRKAPNELEEFFSNLTSLIEEAYVRNNYSPVTLICHSMGCLNSLNLLNRQAQGWKDIFVRRLITLGAPWFGSFKAISAMLFGDNLGIPILSSQKLQSLQSTFPSLMYLFPREPVFQPDRVLIETNNLNYTLRNLHKLFENTGLLDQKEMWLDTRAIARELRAPNVELWCLYGGGVSTPSRISFNDSIKSKNYLEIYDDGDGTVNMESLRACELFQSQQEKPVYSREFNNVDHIAILRAPGPAEFIAKHIMNHEKKER